MRKVDAINYNSDTHGSDVKKVDQLESFTLRHEESKQSDLLQVNQTNPQVNQRSISSHYRGESFGFSVPLNSGSKDKSNRD